MIKEVTLKPPVIQINETLPTEEKNGLQFAIVHEGKKIIALVGDLYWARRFVDISPDMNFEIREVA